MGDSSHARDHPFKLGDLAPLLRKPCWRKQGHRSEAGAFAQMRSLEKKGIINLKRPDDPRKGKLVTNVYLCRFCGLWHVGRYQKDTPQE